MWKRHPLTRFLFGISLALIFGTGLLLSSLVGADYWADGKLTPIEVIGTVSGKGLQSSLRGGGGVFDLEVRGQSLVYSHLEVRPRIFLRLQNDMEIAVTMSPNTHYIYDIKIMATGEVLQQSYWHDSGGFQDFQAALYWIFIAVGVAGGIAAIYGLFGLYDWLVRPRRIRGVIAARIEQAEFHAAGCAILLRPAPAMPTRRSWRFQLSEADFLATDGQDYAEIVYTPIFRYVRTARPLSITDFPPGQAPALEGGSSQMVRLRYLAPWQRRLLVLSDGLISLFMFGCTLFATYKAFPGSQSNDIQRDTFASEKLLMPGLAIFTLCLAVLFSINFFRKLGDLRAPKRLTIGPVLSKWRVNGGTNDTRRQIVVADGGLYNSGAAIRKFDISNFLFEELRVGDIVEIEHTPRLRYIFRLEVKGHQELTGSA